jgi:hypothetical protein
MVIANDSGYLVIDGARGQAQVSEVASPAGWDQAHWALQRPHVLTAAELQTPPQRPSISPARPLLNC